MIYLFDYEVFAHDWLLVAKAAFREEWYCFHNDSEGVKGFMEEISPLLCGFNNKHYDRYIHQAVLSDRSPEEVKALNDFIIGQGKNGWEYPPLQGCRVRFPQFDLKDDCEKELSLKAIEAHLGMDIRETTVPFDLDRPLTEAETEEVLFYCKHDVLATERLLALRENYLKTKLSLGRIRGIPDEEALYMTNAKLTAAYLGARKGPVRNDEREYTYPDNLLRRYIPDAVFAFFDRIRDKRIPDEALFQSKLSFSLGPCLCTVGYGGIHGAIPHYRERASPGRTIRNRDVASYYPHLMTLDGYCSRSIPDPRVYADMLEQRIRAKREGNKEAADALKLVANTTYGAMLNPYNDLYDPRMGLSVCITGQLRLLELAGHLMCECPTLKIVQLNTDGIMVSLGNADLDAYNAICQEWQDRTGFTLEEDRISEIVQKDVNNYVEIAEDGSTKSKGGLLVRGIAPAGAFHINSNATVVAKALHDYFAKGIPVEETIDRCNDILSFQLIAKASGKYAGVYHTVDGKRIPVQKCNRSTPPPTGGTGRL